MRIVTISPNLNSILEAFSIWAYPINTATKATVFDILKRTSAWIKEHLKFKFIEFQKWPILSTYLFGWIEVEDSDVQSINY